MPEESDLLSLARTLRREAGRPLDREALLERLANEIRTGQYRVDVDALAERLLDEFDENPPE